jgi:hypothetical protein
VTALQLDPSAHAPWTRTMFGLFGISVFLSISESGYEEAC